MREINPFGLRMPVVLKRRLVAHAKRNGRSLNYEIPFRIGQTMSPQELNGLVVDQVIRDAGLDEPVERGDD